MKKKYLLFATFGIMIQTTSYTKNGMAASVNQKNEATKNNNMNNAENADQYAFPGAEGFGRIATGGRGGEVIKVTSLNDAGPGSLREAINTDGARIVVFEVSGTIALQSKLSIHKGDITIAGQTAPGDGICIKNYHVAVDADNVIIRYMRFRMGDEAAQEDDALGGRFHHSIIIDHCSMSWSTDECVSFYANEISLYNGVLLQKAFVILFHAKGAHGYGGIWGGKNASFHHNLIANNDSRNPRLGEQAGKAFALTDLVDLRNNVVYNWHTNSCYGGEAMNVNIVNCYYKPGPATPKATKERIVAIDKNKIEGTEVYNIWGKFYITGNVLEGSDRATQDNWTYGVNAQFHKSYGTISDKDKKEIHLLEPLEINNNVTTLSATDAYAKVLSYSGASLKRDAVDARTIEHVKNRSFEKKGSKGSTDGIIDSQNDVGGWPKLRSAKALKDTDNDGMPDVWEKAHHLNPAINDANGKDLSTFYDNIEMYINSLVQQITDNQLRL